MAKQIDAVYENGVFRPLEVVDLEEHWIVRLIIEDNGDDSLAEIRRFTRCVPPRQTYPPPICCIRTEHASIIDLPLSSQVAAVSHLADRCGTYYAIQATRIPAPRVLGAPEMAGV